MKKLQKLSCFALGFSFALLISSTVMPIFAALSSKSIQVSTGVNIYLDDNKFVPKDAKGNQVEVFIYNGTTYLPARAISEAAGLPVQWDGATSSVYIGKHSSEKPAVMLHELDTFTGSGFSTKTSAQDNYGNTYYDCICYSSSGTYKINGQYTKIAGTLFQQYDYRSSSYTSTLKIYGDGKLLFTGEMSGGIDPIDFSIDLTGVLELVVEWSTRPQSSSYAGIANCGLYT